MLNAAGYIIVIVNSVCAIKDPKIKWMNGNSKYYDTPIKAWKL